MLKFNIKKHYLIEKDRYQLYPQGVIEGIDVTTISRPLTMRWTPEMAQAEIDREIIRNLRGTFNDRGHSGHIPKRV